MGILIAYFSLEINAQTLRVFRILRVVRILHTLRMISVFNTLVILISSIKACWSSFIWSGVFLVIVQSISALLFCSTLSSYIGEIQDPRQQLAMYEYFGDIRRSFISMLELTLGNWVPILRILTDFETNHLYGTFAIIYVYLVNFAIVRVIGGVFLQQTFAVAANDPELMVLQRRRNEKKYLQQMNDLLSLIDTNGDRCASLEEFCAAIEDPHVRSLLQAMDLECGDSELLFSVLDNGDGSLTLDELVHGVRRITGFARSIDVTALTYRTVQIQSALVGLTKKLDSFMRNTPRSTRGDTVEMDPPSPKLAKLVTTGRARFGSD